MSRISHALVMRLTRPWVKAPEPGWIPGQRFGGSDRMTWALPVRKLVLQDVREPCRMFCGHDAHCPVGALVQIILLGAELTEPSWPA